MTNLNTHLPQPISIQPVNIDPTPALQRDATPTPDIRPARQRDDRYAELPQMPGSPAGTSIFSSTPDATRDIQASLSALTDPQVKPESLPQLANQLAMLLNCKAEFDHLAASPDSALGLLEQWTPPAGFFPTFPAFQAFRAPGSAPHAYNTTPFQQGAPFGGHPGGFELPGAGVQTPMTGAATLTNPLSAIDAQTAEVRQLSTAQLLNALAKLGTRQSPNLPQMLRKIQDLLKLALQTPRQADAAPAPMSSAQTAHDNLQKPVSTAAGRDAGIADKKAPDEVH